MIILKPNYKITTSPVTFPFVDNDFSKENLSFYEPSGNKVIKRSLNALTSGECSDLLHRPFVKEDGRFCTKFNC